MDQNLTNQSKFWEDLEIPAIWGGLDSFWFIAICFNMEIQWVFAFKAIWPRWSKPSDGFWNVCWIHNLWIFMVHIVLCYYVTYWLVTGGFQYPFRAQVALEFVTMQNAQVNISIVGLIWMGVALFWEISANHFPKAIHHSSTNRSVRSSHARSDDPPNYWGCNLCWSWIVNRLQGVEKNE